MKIGILTHPLGVNYGGILQAYALFTVLEQMGHQVIVLRRDHDLSFFKNVVKKILISINYPRYNSPKYHKLRQFIKSHIYESPRLSSTEELKSFVRKKCLDLVIVGSDQVWRADYAMRFGYDYFLDFVPEGIKRASYAASFGLSEWKYSAEQSEIIKNLLKKFSSVSVREFDGQMLCEKYLNCNPDIVLDPTMLLPVDHYESIISKRIVDESYVYVYWLGSDEDKLKILDRYKNMKIVDVSLRQGEPLSSVEEWLSYIKYADIVITDSFHGCVFSLLFHRQFVMHVNKTGGFGRIESLYKLFEIDYKLLDIYQEIDYSFFEEKLKDWRIRSMNYLKSL